MSLQYKLPEIKTTGTSMGQNLQVSSTVKRFFLGQLCLHLWKNKHVDILKFLVLKKVVFNVLSIQMYSICAYTLFYFS